MPKGLFATLSHPSFSGTNQEKLGLLHILNLYNVVSQFKKRQKMRKQFKLMW